MAFDLFSSNLDDLIKENTRGLASLCKTKKIEKTDLEDPIWNGIHSNYLAAKSMLSLDVVTLLNAVYFQKRIVFCFSRSNAALLVKQDPQRKGGYDNNRYEAFLAHLLQLKIISVVQEPVTRAPLFAPGIYRISEPRILAALQGTVDEGQQLIECRAFVSKGTPRQGEQTGTPDTGLGEGKEKGEGEGQERGGNPPSLAPSLEGQPKGEKAFSPDEPTSFGLSEHPPADLPQRDHGDSSDPDSENYIYKEGDEYKPSRNSLGNIPVCRRLFFEGVKNLPAIGAKQESHEVFAAQLVSLIKRSECMLNNSWGEPCDTFQPSFEEIKKIVRLTFPPKVEPV